MLYMSVFSFHFILHVSLSHRQCLKSSSNIRACFTLYLNFIFTSLFIQLHHHLKIRSENWSKWLLFSKTWAVMIEFCYSFVRMMILVNHMKSTVVEWIKMFESDFITNSFVLMTSHFMNSCFLLIKSSQCLCWGLSALNLIIWNFQIYSSSEKHFQILTSNAFFFWNHFFSDMINFFVSWTWEN